jgi:threonine/homoserine/homoserine lactone efflux protein
VPVEPATLAAFAVAVLAIVVSPGPDTMLILRYALTSGQKAGFAAVAGVQIGLMIHTVLAILGISLLIASSPVLFKAVAIAGAGYLAWLGIQGFREGGAFRLDGDRRPVGAARACRDAVITNVLNPKVILLFLALLPNFVVTGRGDVPAQLITLSVVLIVINVTWQAPLAWAAQVVRGWLVRPSVQRAVSRLGGAILLLFAGLMLYEHLVL